MGERYKMLSRVMMVLRTLEGTPTGLTTRRLAQLLATAGYPVDQVTVRRDLSELEYMGFVAGEVQLIQGQETTVWKLASALRSMKNPIFNNRELLALLFMKRSRAQYRGVPLAADLQTAFAKIESLFGSAASERFLSYSAVVVDGPEARILVDLEGDIFDTVHQACLDRKVLTFEYDSIHSGTKRARRVGPHFLFYAQAALYLVAEDLETASYKTFCLHRMRGVVAKADYYERPQIEPREFFRHAFGIFCGGDPQDVRLRFSGGGAKLVKERLWHPSQKVVCVDDGDVELSLQVAVTPELLSWVMSFGEAVEVIGPKTLRREVTSQVKSMAKCYF